MGYRVKLNVFEGPFDLLVYLIEHAQMSIYDIKISEITSQYLSYVEDMKKADINVSSEFMVLAAALLEIKSRMLLPRQTVESGNGQMTEDPRTELVEKLVEYKKYKMLAEMLQEKAERTAMQLEKPQEDLTEYTGEPDEYLVLDIEKFRSAFEHFLVRKRRIEEIREHHRRTEKQRVTTEIRMQNIRDFFKKNNIRETDFRTLIHKKDDKYDVAVTFSSVLEMMKEKRLDAEQPYLFGDITIKATEHLFDAEIKEDRDEIKETADGQQ